MRLRFLLVFVACISLATVNDVDAVTSTLAMRADKGTRSTRNLRIPAEERTFDFKNIDDLINAANIENAMKSSSKQYQLFTAWAKHSAITDDVLKALSTDPKTNEKVLQAFRAHTAKVDDLATAQIAKVEWSIATEKQTAMFKSWFKNEAVSDAIVKKLSANFRENEAILLAYNEYRTVQTYGKTFDDWLRLWDLHAIAQGTKDKDQVKVNNTYGKWFQDERTVDDLKNALKGETLLQIKYKYVVNEYDAYVKKIEAKIAKLTEADDTNHE